MYNNSVTCTTRFTTLILQINVLPISKKQFKIQL